MFSVMEKKTGFTTTITESLSMKHETDKVRCETYFRRFFPPPPAFNQSHSLYVNLITLQQTNNFIMFFPFDSP